MIIEVGNVLCRVLSASPEESEWVQRYLSFEDASFKGRGRGRRGRRISMFSTIKSTFPGGLLPLVVDAGVRDGVKIEQLDKRIPRLVRDPNADLAWLRPYQIDAVDACVNSRRGIIRAPTGCLTGDTIITVNRNGWSMKIRLDVLVARLEGKRTQNVDVNGREGRWCSWDLSVPTLAQSVDSEGFIRLNPIVRGWSNGVAEVFEVLTASGQTINATAAHRFYVDGEYIRLDDLREGDRIGAAQWPTARETKSAKRSQHLAGRVVADEIVSIKSLGEQAVYDLQLADPMNNYVANDFVVHNSGKGDMIVGVVKALPGRWLFLVHRENLVGQQAKRYQRLSGQPAYIVKPYWDDGGKAWHLQPGLNLMTLQLLAAGIRRDKEMVDAALADVDGLVIDECHVAPADIYFNAIQRCPAEYRLGFSGTPLDRTDNRSLMAIAALGRVIYSIKASTLIEAGVLAAPRITMVQVHQKAEFKGGPSRSSRGPGSFHKIYEELITTSKGRNEAICELAKGAPKPCMVFVKQIAHGKVLAKMLGAAGLTTEFVWGNTSAEARAAAIERLEHRDADVMVASVVLQEGVDIPSLESVIIGSGGKSVIATLQRIGRGMRTDGGRKASFEVFDILDMGSPMMERHSRRRMNTYVREGYQTIVQAQDGTLTGYTPKLRTRREKRERSTFRSATLK